jgi:hypothetical protein
MSQRKVKDVTISLKTIDHLFFAPEVNPFAEDELELLGEPALLRVVKREESGFRGRKIRLTVLLPPDQLTPDLPEEVEATIRRYCQTRIVDNRLEIRRILWSGLRALPFGLVFLGVSMGLSAMFNSQVLTFIPDGLNRLFAEGFVIIGWIALWNPVGILLYDWVPVWHDNEVYHYLMAMDIRFQPQPPLGNNRATQL